MKSRAPAIALSGFLAGGLVAAGTASAEDATPRAVLELFTSQGCSSCPPADKLFGDYTARTDILALSFPVDYWDYLGWKDTLASHDNSERQRAYANARGDGEVYTPQIIVDGRTDVVGSDRSAIEVALKRFAADGLPIPITLAEDSDATTVTIGKAPAGSDMRGTIWLAMYDSAVEVPIGRGENGGRTITYRNVVRMLRPIAMWKGEPMSVDLPNSERASVKAGHCAVFLQAETKRGLPGPMLGAAIEQE